MKLATKAAIGGALTGASEGFLRGYGIGADIQARRIAAKRTSRMEKIEDEQRELAKRQEQREITTIQESSTDRARLRAEKIAEISITADFEKAPAEQQTAVFDEISTALTPAIPEENQRALATQQIMETSLQRKKDEARKLAAELEATKALATSRREKKGEDRGTVAATTKATLYKLGQAKAAIRSLEELWKETEPSESGVGAKIEGVGRSIGASIGAAPKTQLYQDTSGGLMALVSKSFGESGVLTDADITRASKLAARVGDSAQIARRKFDTLLKLVAHGEKNAMLIEKGLPPAPFDWGSESQNSAESGWDPLNLRAADFGAGQP